MIRNCITITVRATRPFIPTASTMTTLSLPTTRKLSTTTPNHSPSSKPVSSVTQDHKVVVIGGGSAGLTISNQLLRSGRFTQDDIAIVDPATWHHYQPGWTLVGGGLKTKEELRQPLNSLVNPKLKFYNEGVATFTPKKTRSHYQAVEIGSAMVNSLSFRELRLTMGVSGAYLRLLQIPTSLSHQSIAMRPATRRFAQLKD